MCECIKCVCMHVCVCVFVCVSVHVCVCVPVCDRGSSRMRIQWMLTVTLCNCLSSLVVYIYFFTGQSIACQRKCSVFNNTFKCTTKFLNWNEWLNKRDWTYHTKHCQVSQLVWWPPWLAGWCKQTHLVLNVKQAATDKPGILDGTSDPADWHSQNLFS